MARSAPPHGRPRLDLLDPLEVSKLGGLEIITQGVVEGFLNGLHRSPRRGFSVEFAEHGCTSRVTSFDTSTGRSWAETTGCTLSSSRRKPTFAPSWSATPA